MWNRTLRLTVVPLVVPLLLGAFLACSGSSTTTSAAVTGIDLPDATVTSLDAILQPLASYLADKQAGSPRVAQINEQFPTVLTDADAKLLFELAASLNVWQRSTSPAGWTPPPGLTAMVSHYGALPYFGALLPSCKRQPAAPDPIIVCRVVATHPGPSTSRFTSSANRQGAYPARA